MRICFLLTHVPNPRMNKRINVFKEWTDTRVICTRRAGQDIWEPVQNVQHVIFNNDLPSARKLVKRYLLSQDFQKKALSKLIEFNPDIIYAEGLDTLIIAGKYKKKKTVRIVYEVADLRENYIIKPKKIVERLITEVLLKREKKEFRNVDLLVVTSYKFYDLHYESLILRDRVLNIPNVPEAEVFRDYRKKQNGDFTVGFIGGIRYLHQMKLLVDAAKIADCKVLFAGAGGTSTDYKEIKEYCEECDYVRFTGKYDYNTQIAKLYGMVDCVFAVYDADNPNVKIALPNKLYEAIQCELPIIVAKETYLGELVEEWGVGVAVDFREKNELVWVLDKLQNDKKYYEDFVDRCVKYKKEINLAKYNEYLKRQVLDFS